MSPSPPTWPIIGPGIWLDIRQAALTVPAPALFLDRDGIVIKDTGYVSDPNEIELVQEMIAVIKTANEANVPVLVVTNQSGVDRGLLDWGDFAAVEARIAALLLAAGVKTDATAACPFHPDHTTGYNQTHAQWRKPGPKLLTTLADRLHIDLASSWLIGDQKRDIEAARNAGLAGGILFGTVSPTDHAPLDADLSQPDFTFRNLSTTKDALATLRETALLNSQ